MFKTAAAGSSCDAVYGGSALTLREDDHSESVWYLPLQAAFANLTCIDASRVPQPSHHRLASSLGSYALKIFALYATSFEEVLLLDCDSMPIIDPQDAFDSAEYRYVGVDDFDKWSPHHYSCSLISPHTMHSIDIVYLLPLHIVQSQDFTLHLCLCLMFWLCLYCHAHV